MCLYSKQILPRRAKKDIIVYKQLIDDIRLGMMTPFHDFKIKPEDFGKVLETTGYKCIQPVYSSNQFYSFNQSRFAISIGYFHCFKTFPMKLIGTRVRRSSYLFDGWIFKEPNQLLSNSYILVECTIPKGSQYWIGINNNICSDKLILNRILSATELYELACNNK